MRAILIATVLVALASVPARAETEFCPATALRVQPAPAAGGKAGTVFAFRIGAMSPRIVSGVLRVYASADVYEVPFTNVKLVPHKEPAAKGDGQLPAAYDANAESDTLTFTFDAAKSVDAVWVFSAAPVGEPQVDCPTVPASTSVHSVHGGTPADEELRAQAPFNPIKAVLVTHVDVGACKTVYVAPSMTDAVFPDWPAGVLAPRPLYVVVRSHWTIPGRSLMRGS